MPRNVLLPTARRRAITVGSLQGLAIAGTTVGPSALASMDPPALTTGNNPRGVAIEQGSNTASPKAGAGPSQAPVPDGLVASVQRLVETGAISKHQARALDVQIDAGLISPTAFACSGVVIDPKRLATAAQADER
jgi:hypothetical protein